MRSATPYLSSGPVARRTSTTYPGWTAFAVFVFVGFLMSLGPVGKDLLHNPVKTGIPTDPYAEHFNRARYLLIALCIGAAALQGRIYASARQVAHILPFGVLAVLSVLWSPDVVTTTRNAVVMLGFIFAMGVISQRNTPRTFLITLMHFLAIIVLISAFLALFVPEIGRHAASDVLEKGHAGKWRGMFAHKNALGSYAAIATVTLFTQAPINRYNWPYWWSARIAAVLCVVFAGSANSIVGALSGFAAYALLRRRATTRWPFLLLVGLAGLALSSIAANLVALLGRDTTFTGRTEIWAGALEIWSHSPWLGYSYAAGNIFILEPELKRMLFSSAVDAHNGYIDILFSLGIVGAGLFFLAVAISVAHGYRACVARESPDRSVTVAYMVIVLMSCVMALAEVSPLRLIGNGGYMLWIALAMLSHPSLRPAPSGTTRTGSRRRSKRRRRSEPQLQAQTGPSRASAGMAD